LEAGAEGEIEVCLDREHAPEEPPQVVEIIQADALELFRRSRAAVLPAHALAGWVVAVDPGHGATCATTPEVLRRLGATVHTHAANPDGALINTDAGSEHPAHLADLVKKTGARVGFAHDGDGDRLVACDETGAIIEGDEVLGLLGLHFLRKGELCGNVLVATVQSNMGLDQTLAAAGGRVERVAVGDRNVLHRLIELNATFGGENSGHYIFSDVARCGDGLLAALMLARVMRETGRPLSALRTEVKLLPQVTANLRVREKPPLDETPTFGPALQAAEKTLAGRGRVLARYSGTEKKLRLLVEGPVREEIAQALETLKKAAAKDLGAE
jgi:phosphoglucosamine mutase